MPKVYTNYFGSLRAKGSFLASETGLKLETKDLTSLVGTLGTEVTQGGVTEKVILSGTVYPSNTTNATGIVFEDIYQDSEGHYVGSIMTGGYVYEERLAVSIQTAAITSLKALGLYVLKYPKTTRPNFGNGGYEKLETPTVSVSSGTASWGEVANATGYAVFLNDKLVVITKNTSLSITEGASGDVVKVQAQGDYSNYSNSDFGTAKWA